MNKDNLTYAWTFTLAVIARVIYVAVILYVTVISSGWFILLIIFYDFIPFPQRHFKVELSPEQIAESFIAEVKRAPNKYRQLMR